MFVFLVEKRCDNLSPNQTNLIKFKNYVMYRKIIQVFHI